MTIVSSFGFPSLSLAIVPNALASPELQAFATGFPVLLLHAGASLLLLALAAVAYALLSPWKEISQIRDGNPAACVAFSGVLVGLAAPLAVSLSVSTAVAEILLWGAIAAVMQLLAFRLVDFALTGLPQRVKEGDVPAAVLLAAGRLAVSLILAAALTG